jgi:hypothetical protein
VDRLLACNVMFAVLFAADEKLGMKLADTNLSVLMGSL